MATYKIYVNLPDKSSCAYYRNLLPVINLRDELLKHNIEVENSIPIDGSGSYDCYILSRIPDNADIFNLIHYLYAVKKKKIIWELDDELWAIPESSPSKDHYPDIRVAWLAHYFGMSKHIIASTNNLARSINDRFNVNHQNITVLENLIDYGRFKSLYKTPDYYSDQVKIMWSGSNTHKGDLDAIKLVFERYENNDNIIFVFFGYMPDEYKLLPPTKVIVLPWTVRKYYEGVLSFISPHISLLPLADNSFNKCKSSIKHFETAVLGSVPVAQNLPPFSDTIRNHDSGYLCDSNDDWLKYCDTLISDRPLMNFRGLRAKEQVIEEYSWDTDNRRRRKWLEFFKSIPDL